MYIVLEKVRKGICYNPSFEVIKQIHAQLNSTNHEISTAYKTKVLKNKDYCQMYLLC